MQPPLSEDRGDAPLLAGKRHCEPVGKAAGNPGYLLAPHEGIVDEEHEAHRQHGPQTDGLQRITGSLHGTGTDVRGYVEHLESGFEPRHGEWVLDQPDASEDDEVHHSEEAGEHRRDDADECELEGVDGSYQMAIAYHVFVGVGQQEDGWEGEDEADRGVRGPGCGAGCDIHLRGGPLQSHAQQVSDVPCGGDGEADLEAGVGGDTTEDSAYGDADEHFLGIPVAYLEGVLQVLLFEVLLEHSRVEIVVHVLVEPSQRTLLYRLEARGSDWLSIGGTLDVGHATLSYTRAVTSRLYFSRLDEPQEPIARGSVVARYLVAAHGFHPLDPPTWLQGEL